MVGLLPLAAIQVALGALMRATIPAGAPAGDYPSVLLALALSRAVAMSIGAYAAARATLGRNPDRHGVLAAMLLTLAAMALRLVQPLPIPSFLDLLVAMGVAAVAGLWGARAAARRGAAA